MDNGAHFDGDQSGTVNGVTPPAVQHLTAEVTADSGEYQVLARWDTPKVVKGVSFLLRLTVAADDGSERLVSTARTTETTYRFRQLAPGNYRLTVRAVNSRGQQGDPASVSFRIAAPAAPSRIELTPGYFQITATPHLAVYDPTVQFEFWFSETRITDIRQVETTARYLGTALYWIAASINIKPGHDYYFYVRSVNTVGKSTFVEAVGRASDDAEGYLDFFRGAINKTHLGREINERIDASARRTEVEQLENEINREMTQLEKDVRQRAERDIAGVTKKITASENSITELVAKKSGEQSLAIAKVDRKVDSVSSEIRQTVSRSTEENSRQIAQIRQYVDDKGSQITQSTDKKLGSWNASIEQIQKVQEDTRRNLNSMWAVKLQQTRDGRLYIAGIGAGIENTSDGIQSQILMQADRIAMINPENGNTTPLFVAQGDQLFMNDVFMKRLFAVSITSSGNPPAFSLTPDGRLTAKNADISGNVNANSGSLNNVTINENCRVLGKLSASQIEGDLVKTVGKAFPRNNSYASGTITVTVYDDQGFDRQIIIPPVLFRGMKHQNFNSKNQQSYWYSTCKLQVLKNGQEIFHEPATDVSRVFSSVIDMPAGHGNVTLTFNVSSYGANNWTPTTSISDLLVVVMKKATAGITIS
ncbi:TPA: DUF1983 domain-containing protein [Escherichia coli]|nr:DUF1983 domain-containing protein [Escherichia coli]